MPLCLETLCVRQRRLLNLPAHNERFWRTRQALWGCSETPPLESLLTLPDWLRNDTVYKCRVTYGPAVEQVTFEPYTVRPVGRLQLVDCGQLSYTFKYADREPINRLFSQRGTADDVLLVREGLLTDTSYANVALFDGRRWYTPTQPLLAGTQRARLLAEGILHPATIRLTDLPDFSFIRLVNAMLDWEQTDNIPVRAILFPR